MRTLQICGNARFGGATTLMLSWSRHLLELGCDVDVLCTDERMKAEVATIPGARLIDDIFIPKEIDPRADVRAFRRLFALCRSRSYDVVHTYTATPSFVGRVAATAARVPAVVNHQGGWAVNDDSTLAERLFFTPLEYAGTLACTRNICVSNAERAKAAALHLAPASKLVTIANGIDVDPYADAAHRRNAVRRAHGWATSTVIIGTTGRLVPGKANATAIRAMARLVLRHPDTDIVLALAGDGDDRAELEQLVIDLDLVGKVRLLGFVDDIPGFLAAIDLFVTPTHSEGLSISILEAMASGRPVVATPIPANAELIADGRTGLFAEVDEPTSFADALSRLIDDPDLSRSLAQAGRDLVRDNYSRSRMFEETWELYRSLVPNKRVQPPVPLRAVAHLSTSGSSGGDGSV